jgi:regulator of protease activity HflC (stomatin/prohibitin superfamily)
MTAHPQTINGRPIPAVPPTQHKWWHFVERRLPIIVIYLMVITLVGAILAPHVVVTVPSGHVGLMWKRFRGGTVLDPRQLKDEGLRVLLPWDKMFLYDLRLQTTTDTYNAITKDGVSINATISIRFRLKHDAVPQLHQAIGPDYIARLVRPEIGSRMREVIADYTAEEVYSTKRQDVQRGIRGHTQKMLSEKTMERTAEQSEYGDAYRVPMDELLNLLDTLVLGIVLPPTVVNAINRKVEQYYLSEEYVFRVAREKKESERKKIEAEGISEFQRIVSQGISDSYLRWRGIEATLQLAQSPNSKIVVIGNSKDGMPIILGNVDSPPAASSQSQDPAKQTERSTSAAPTISLERLPSTHLTPPVERFTSAGPDKPAEKPAETPQATAPATTPQTSPPATTGTGERSSLIPRSLSDVEALISRFLRPETTERKAPETTEQQAAEAAERRAAETTTERRAPEPTERHPPAPMERRPPARPAPTQP